jgi:CheY-like chemotaxis protein
MTQKKILIVDDSLVICRALAMKLEANGYQAFTAAEAGEAIRVVRVEKPDLILLDISFPPDVAHGGIVAWDGFLIMDWLRRSDQARETPFIIITGEELQKNKERALAAGALSFFHKPIDNDELLTAIREALAKSPVGKSLPA